VWSDECSTFDESFLVTVINAPVREAGDGKRWKARSIAQGCVVRGKRLLRVYGEERALDGLAMLVKWLWMVFFASSSSSHVSIMLYI
jgi:hypothetical protein